MRFIYNLNRNSEYVLEGIAYKEEKQEECIDFKIVSVKKEAKISVRIEKGARWVECLKLFEKSLSKYAKRIELNIKPRRRALHVESEYINAVYSIWEKLSEENFNYIKEKLKVFRNTIPGFLGDIKKVCSHAAEQDVSRLVASTNIPSFGLIDKCFWRLEEYKKAKKEPAEDFGNVYNTIASTHRRVTKSLNNVFEDLKEQIATEDKL